MKRPTASALELLLICVGSAIIEHYQRSSPEAEDGKREHAELLPGMLSGELPDTPRGRALAAVELPRDASIEVAIAVDVRGWKARELGTTHRDYSGAGDHEIPGTLDVRAPGWTGELKTGNVWVLRPRDNAQIALGALGAWWVDGKLPLSWLWQVNGAGTLRVMWHHWTAVELMDWRDWFERLLDRVAAARELQAQGARLPLVVGPHCRYCDAVLDCPAHADDGDQTPVDAWRWAAHELARAERREEKARTKVFDGDEGDEHVVRITPRYQRRVDTDRVIELIPELVAHATRKLTATAIDAWAGEQEGRGKYKSHRRQAVTAELADGGAITYEAAYVTEMKRKE